MYFGNNLLTAECVAGSITRYLGYRKLNLIIALE